MIDSEYQAECIKRALEGDAKAGLDVLRMCRDGLDNGQLSGDLAYYLAERITDLLNGISPDRALRIFEQRGPGKPANPFPDWQQHLGAFAALLSQRGYKPKEVATAMCDQRAWIHDKPLEDADAHRIRKKWRPMLEMDADLLERLTGPYWEILSQYPPLK